ncbi:cryptochrome/photolyase family protein [candidate division KSB1 bacterium]|nr:cryptochrome/photolyase family protein [candidate division KSB1 bacterium]RQW07118.1 MAG: cryptochrome/photolyase family protein [candidate division KSB1 bacterium]
MKPDTLRLILGDQLNRQHSWFKKKDANILYVLMELRQETDYVRHHIQKLTGFFAAMRAFAVELKKQGHHVLYSALDAASNTGILSRNLSDLIDRYQIKRFEYILPDEYRLDKQLREFCQSLNIATAAVESEHFLSSREAVADHFHGKKQFVMESFYRLMRKRYNILMEGTAPRGGHWNYDVENRNRYDGSPSIPAPRLFDNDIVAIKKVLNKMKVRTMGETEDKLLWPINRHQSLDLLSHFVEHGLPYFGTFQDAMTHNEWSLFHSRLSFSLNSKMLHPLEVIQAAVDALERKQHKISLAQVEGFVRQILGWREYMRGVYWALMPEFANMNFFHHMQTLPHFYWDGRTKMNCMHQVIRQSLEKAYAHHIQRLMVTGNFALLAGIHPDEVDAWYLGVYIDAIEWVEITNTRGMSQYADGGIIATKPYVSSANYIHKMSDYCQHCIYDKNKKVGEHACPFNSLYWHFYARHRDKLARHPRVGLMYKTWDRMAESVKNEIISQAKYYLENIEKL